MSKTMRGRLQFGVRPNRAAVAATISLALFTALGCHRFESIGGYRAYALQSVSMETTIYKGDTIWCDSNAYKTNPPARGDVVVFAHKDTVLVKRLIGLPGDKVEGKDGVVSVNGVVLNEPYAQHDAESSDRLDTFGPTTVAPGAVFLLGDNRDHSLDSRWKEFGDVQLSDLRGKALSIVKSERGQAGREIR